jgi:hypothetical protein
VLVETAQVDEEEARQNVSSRHDTTGFLENRSASNNNVP